MRGCHFRPLRVSYEKALASDPISAFGGIVGCNRDVDADTAALMADLFIEAIVAPGFTDDAFQILSQTIHSVDRIAQFFDSDGTYQLKYVQGGILVQSPDHIVVDDNQLQWSNRRTESHESRDLRFAFAV